MTRKLGASLQPAGRRFVYDKDPEEITRPDTVPAALRFAEASELSSGIEHARPRELAPYPRIREMTLPDVTAANDEATVVDPPLERPRKELPSGPRHRALATISTVPPPSRARQKIPKQPPAAPPPQMPARVVEQARIITTSPPEAQPRKRWPILFALAATALASAVFGTAIGNGSLERVVERLHASPAPATREAPRPTALTPSNKPTQRPAANVTPVTSLAETPAPPVVRVEDLPLAEEGTGRRVPGPGKRLRTNVAGRR